jgi:hypothetical protein
MAPDAVGMGRLIAMAASDPVLPIRVLRAIRDLAT